MRFLRTLGGSFISPESILRMEVVQMDGKWCVCAISDYGTDALSEHDDFSEADDALEKCVSSLGEVWDFSIREDGKVEERRSA